MTKKRGRKGPGVERDQVLLGESNHEKGQVLQYRHDSLSENRQ